MSGDTLVILLFVFLVMVILVAALLFAVKGHRRGQQHKRMKDGSDGFWQFEDDERRDGDKP